MLQKGGGAVAGEVMDRVRVGLDQKREPSVCGKCRNDRSMHDPSSFLNYDSGFKPKHTFTVLKEFDMHDTQ